MVLKYIWIKKYKNLKEIGFNFNEFEDDSFEYVDEKLVITKNSGVKKPKGFFAKNIKRLTAIVGENGSGKTNLSEFINYNLAHTTGSSGFATYLLEEGNGIIVLNNIIFVQDSIKIKNEDLLSGLGYEIKRYEVAPFDKEGVSSWVILGKNTYIYYNPIFDNRVLRMMSDNITNISRSYLAYNDVYYSGKHTSVRTSYYDKEKNTDFLLAHYRNEKIRESDLIFNYPEIKELIKAIPNVLEINIDHGKENKLLRTPYYSKEEREEDSVKDKSQINFNELEELESYVISGIMLKRFRVNTGKEPSRRYEYKIPVEKRKEGFRILFLVNYFRIFIDINKYPFDKDFIRRFIFDEEYELGDSKMLDKLESIKSDLTSLIESAIWKERIGSFYEEWDIYDTQRFELFNKLVIELDSPKKIELIKSLISTVKATLNRFTHFHYQFYHSLSSGEQNLLNFYSRFYWAKEEILDKEKNEQFGECVVIFIDEGEVTLHPEWQRNFFKLAIDYLSKLFSDREIQIVITTHSPFVLSDIPKENVIFLKKDKNNGNTEIADLEREKTFGANIYSLLSDSFFMEEGTIGEFAKEKIEWVLNILDKGFGDLPDEALEKINYIIDSIGEPLIRMQLESMRDKRLNMTEVSEMKKRIEDLEAQLKKQDDKDKEK